VRLKHLINSGILKVFDVFKVITISLFFLFSSDGCLAQELDLYSLIDQNHITNDFLHPRFQKRVIPSNNKDQGNKEKLKQAENSGDHKAIIALSNALGLNALQKENSEAALIYFKKALSSAKKTGQAKAEAIALIECGLAEQQAKKFNSSLEWFSNAQVQLSKLSIPKLEAFLFAQLGQTHLQLGDLNTAEEFFTRASKGYAGLNADTENAASLNSAGEIQLRKNDYKRALQNFNSAMKIVESKAENKLKAVLQRNIGLVYFKKGKFEAALQSFKTSLSFDNQLLVHKLVKDACMQLFTLYSFSNDFEKADVYHEKYRSIKDSLVRAEKKKSGDAFLFQSEMEEKERVIAMLQKQYNSEVVSGDAKQMELSQLITKADVEIHQKDRALEEKTAEVQNLTKEKVLQQRDLARQELQISKQKNFKNLLLATSIIAFILILFLYNRYAFKKKSNLQLQTANDELENTLKQLRETQDQLLHSEKMASLGLLTAGIAHEIQNPLNFVINFSEGTLQVVDEFLGAKDEKEKTELAHEINTSLKKIHQHGKRAERIVKSMLQHSREGNGEKELTDINQLLYESIHLAYHGVIATHKEFQCEMIESFDKNIPKLNVIPQDLSRVFLNLANNAFYALREKGLQVNGFQSQMSIGTQLNSEFVEIRLRDNGSGIPKNKLDKIFQPFFTTKPSGQGTGLGLSMSYDIITKLHQGKIEVDSSPNEYTEFVIRLPLNISNG